MNEIILSFRKVRRVFRISVSSFFFMQGLCFGSWATRIPSIQQQLSLTETGLGLVLFALPVGSLLGLPLSSSLINRWGSRRVAINAMILYSLILVGIGFAPNILLLVASLVLFGAIGNISNIAINTQAVGVEARFNRSIMASFHGLWSLAGFAAGAMGNYMIGNNILPGNHFIIIALMVMTGLAIFTRYLLPSIERKAENTSLFVKPSPLIFKLGIIVFCCMLCEGAMFDWSGVYFQKVVRADAGWVGAGFTAFMLTMATGRFIADAIVSKIGFKKTVRFSGALIVLGLAIALLLPSLWTAILGFLIVGFGVSSVVPLVYSEAGKSGNNTGTSLAAVSSIGFLGFLIGPPLIGLVAGMFDLRISFVLIAICGASIIPLASRYKH